MTNLRETKKAATRAALAEAATHIALTQGVEGLTVAAVAEAAGVSPRTFHNYFSSREEALFYSIKRRVESLLEEVHNVPKGLSLLSTLEEVVVRGLHRTTSHSASLYVLTRLGEVAEALGKKDIKQSLDEQLQGLVEQMHACYPEMSVFEVKITLGVATQAASVALLDFYRQPHQPLAEGERLLRRAFDVLRRLG
ncbi:TetR family transcriptional regulator [Corynebacterium mastitidis]|uniref:TetR family transcriptional regulator n=1 Tax=Corynebacterium mastitidis TaxID=161890 RepID=UPI00254FE004|nr:TetR family transcriptional regulator [Corynebacterium mastitidis]MDK8451121.1 TetR family transcriptional regulator [Corynebacterium mastitidis]